MTDITHLIPPGDIKRGAVEPGGLVCYRDSSGWIALAIAGGHAARRLGLRTGTTIILKSH